MLKPGDLNHLYIQTHHLHYQRAFSRLAAFGLGEGQPKLLRHLAEEDGMSQAELARRCNLKPATITVALTRMEKAGLVERQPDASDLRITRIRLTKAGRDLHDKVRKVFLESEEECFEGFSGEDRERLAGYLLRMQENMLHAEEEQTRGV